MAKKNQIFIDVVIDDKGTTKRVAVDAKKLGVELDKSGAATEKNTKNTEKLSKSNKDLDRNLRGTAKMTSNGTKEFSKMQQGMGGLVGAYATLAAQIFAVSAAFQFLSRASEITNLIEGQRAMGNVTGVAYGTITDRVIEATDAQLKYGDAARAAAIGTAAGLQAGQLTELANAAKNASFALGRDLTDSFNRLIRGVTKAEPELLDELGIILRLETATEKYAISIGKSRTELNEYERTQAVANEVLEQTTRKFAAIEAQMDPNSAALAQFAKSFDDLVRGFQEMLIKGLRPVLQFLSENTIALTAALTLFALPIVKAILPSLGDWEASTKKLEKRNRRFFNSYKKGLKNSGKELNTFIKTQQQLEKSATKSARKILKGTEGSAGIDFLRGEGESGDRRKQAAARKIIENALQQTKAGKDAETGYLKGKNREQVLDLQRSYDARVNSAKAANKKTMLSFAFAFKVIKGGILGVQTVWQGAMLAMARAATIAAAAINFAFKATAIIGVLALIYEAGAALVRFFFPLTEQQKRQNAIVKELDGSYTKLIETMQGARKARDTLLAGAERQINIGNILSSTDVEDLIKRINKFSELDTDTDGYENIQKELKLLVGELARIDPKFKSLNKNIEDGKVVLPQHATSVKVLANEYIDLGVRLSNIPNLIKEANEAFADLSKGINNTPLSNVVDSTAKAIKGLELGISEASKSSAEFTSELNLANQLDKEIKIIEQRMGTMNQLLGDREKMEKLTDPEGGFLTKQQQKELKQTQIETLNILIAQEKQLVKFNKRYKFANEQEQKLLRLRQESLKVATVDAQKRAVGNDLAARLINFDEQRNKIVQKIAKAEEKVTQAEVALFQLEGTKKATAEEALETQKVNLKLVMAEAAFENRVLDFKRAQLDLELRLLEVARQQLALDENRSELQRRLAFSKATGANTLEAKAEQRTLNKELLENAVAGAKLRVQKAQEAQKIEEDRIRQNTLQSLRGNKDFQFTMGDDQGNEEIKNRILQMQDSAVDAFRLTPQGQGAVKEERALKNAQNLLDIENSKVLTFKNQNKFMLQQAQQQVEMVGFTKAHVLFNQRVNEARQKGVVLSTSELQLLRQQAIQTTMLGEIAASKQQLFFSIGDSITGAFTSIIDGSMSAKDAFKQMAKSIIADIISMMVRLVVMRTLMSFLPFGGLGNAAPGIPAGGLDAMPGWGALGGGSTGNLGYARMGGIFEQPKGYSMGGIARGSDHGYPAILHGREAVVPLPSGDKIPVELNGAGGQQNNVTVNVTMNGDGTASSNTEADGTSRASNIGKMVARAVQDELMEQKRAGGILSPYGAA